ncbi:hypothetical protein [Azospirillum argentinense]
MIGQGGPRVAPTPALPRWAGEGDDGEAATVPSPAAAGEG